MKAKIERELKEKKKKKPAPRPISTPLAQLPPSGRPSYCRAAAASRIHARSPPSLGQRALHLLAGGGAL
jgi:hypothetical protein